MNFVDEINRVAQAGHSEYERSVLSRYKLFIKQANLKGIFHCPSCHIEATPILPLVEDATCPMCNDLLELI